MIKFDYHDNNKSSLLQEMPWHQIDDKPLAVPMMIQLTDAYINGILPKGPYPPCLRMADRALLAGYTRYMHLQASMS